MSRIRNIDFPQTVAASPIVATNIHADDLALIVVEKAPALSLGVEEVCRFLGIRVEPVAETLGIADALHALRPIGIIAAADEIDCAVYDLLMAVAGFERDLPLLLITDDRASVRGAVHSALMLWQLTGLIHLTRRLETSDLIDFIFRAGRKNGTGHLLPV